MQPNVDRRAEPRFPAKVPLVVDGRDVYHKPFNEETHTVLVSDRGALIALAAELQVHDRARLKNQNTGHAVSFRVAWRSAQQLKGRWSYGIALLDAPDNFWGLQE